LPSTNDYCFGGGAFVQLTWTYSGENPQASYDMQIVESGQAFSDINNVVENPNALVPSSLGGDRYASRVVNITTDPEYSYNKTYKARVRLRDTLGYVSDWLVSSPATWSTPVNAYPKADFTFSPTRPAVGLPVLFNGDAPNVEFYDGLAFGHASHLWKWVFGDGTELPEGGSTLATTTHEYQSEGIFYPSLRVVDGSGLSCTYQTSSVADGGTGGVNVQKPIPEWKEVAPR